MGCWETAYAWELRYARDDSAAATAEGWTLGAAVLVRRVACSWIMDWGAAAAAAARFAFAPFARPPCPRLLGAGKETDVLVTWAQVGIEQGHGPSSPSIETTSSCTTALRPPRRRPAALGGGTTLAGGGDSSRGTADPIRRSEALDADLVRFLAGLRPESTKSKE
jgi:hypothetical protein